MCILGTRKLKNYEKMSNIEKKCKVTRVLKVIDWKDK